MRIDRLALRDFLAHEAIDVQADRPLMVVTGPNAVGKSSLLDAIRWCLLGQARGVPAKDSRALIRRGARTCRVDVEAVGAKGPVAVRRTPSGSTPGQAHVLAGLGVDGDVLAAVLEADTFVDAKPAQRRMLAVRAVGAALSEDALRAAGVTDPDVIAAAMQRGIEAGLRLATDRRRAAQREADAARVPIPEDRAVDGGARLSALDIAEIRRGLDSIARRRDGLQVALAMTRAEAAARARASEAYARALEAAGGEDAAALRARAAALPMPEAGAVEPAREALEAALAAAREASQRVARCEGTVKESADSLWGKVRAIARDIAAVAPKASEDLEALASRAGVSAPEAAQAALEAARKAALAADRKAARARKDHEAAVASAAARREAEAEAAVLLERAKALEAAAAACSASLPCPLGEPLSTEGTEAAIAALDARAANGRRILEDVAAYRAAAEAARAGEARAQQAAERGAAYAAMEEALKPDGVVSGRLTDPRARIAALAADIGARMGVSGIALDEGWEIAVNGAPVSLLSASEAWRVRAAFALAFGEISGVRFALLDEASVCVGTSRALLVAALVAARASYDQVWIASSRGEREPAVVLPPALEAVARVVPVSRPTPVEG